jgi:MacB-like periplasmic core domain
LLRGREFTPADEKNQSTMIINEAMARKFWPEADPIGKTLLNRDYRNPLEIIGIVGDVRGAGLNAQAKLEMYTPFGILVRVSRATDKAGTIGNGFRGSPRNRRARQWRAHVSGGDDGPAFERFGRKRAL